MEEKRKYSSSINDVMLLPRSALEFLKEASAIELKVLIYISSQNGVFENEDVCEALNVTESELSSALGFWRGAKVLRIGDAKEIPKKASQSKMDTMQEYDAKELAEAKTNDSAFATVCEFFSSQFNKATLTRADLNSLYYLYQYVGIPCELICEYIDYCAKNGKRGTQYLVKTSLGFYEDSELDTTEKFREYLSLREVADENVNKMRQLLGIGGRALTTTQKQYFARWFEERQHTFELVRYAYEITVDKIDKPNLKYMDTILERWFSQGILTVEHAEKDRESYKRENEGENNDTFDFDEFLAIAKNRDI